MNPCPPSAEVRWDASTGGDRGERTVLSLLSMSHVAAPLHGSSYDWIGLLSMSVLSLGLLVVLLLVITRPFAKRGSRGEPLYREETPASLSRAPAPGAVDRDAQPPWWSQFEREFAAHVAGQESTRHGRGAGGEAKDSG
jgi:hypothetical protein